MEQFGTVNISRNMVYILFIYNDFRITALYEFLLQFFERSIHFNSLNLSTGHHTVAYFSIGEIKGILEYLHLIINFIFIGSIIDTWLHKIIKVYLRKAFIRPLSIHLHTYQTQQALTQESTELADRPQYHIAQISYRTEDRKQAVRVRLEKRLWQKLTCKEYYQRRQNGICRHRKGCIKTSENRIVEKTGYQNTINYKGYIVAHEHGTDKAIRMIIKQR